MHKKIKTVFIFLAMILGLTSCSSKVVNQEQASTESKIIQNKSEDTVKHINKKEESENKNDSLNNVNKSDDEKKSVITEKNIKGKEKQKPEKKIKKTAIENSGKKPKKNTVDKKKSVDEIIKDIYNGKYGNGEERFRKLKAEGYNPKEIQEKIDKIELDKQMALQKQKKELKKIVSTKKEQTIIQETKKSESNNKNTKPVKTQKATPRYSKEQVVSMVLNGKLGNGDARKRAIEKLGFNYKEIQGLVNKRTEVNTSKPPKKTTYKKSSIYDENGKVFTLEDSGMRYGHYETAPLQAQIDQNRFVYTGPVLSVNDGQSNGIFFHWYLKEEVRYWKPGKIITVVDAYGNVKKYKMTDRLFRSTVKWDSVNKWNKSSQLGTGYESIYIQTCMGPGPKYVKQEFLPY